MPVSGNGMTLGLTNGTYTGGLQSLAYMAGVNMSGTLQVGEPNYGTTAGSSGSSINYGGGFESYKTLGVTTDPTKSGLVCNTGSIGIPSLAVGKFYIKY